MGMTFNRRPLSVNTPSSSDLKEHFFNHYNWKGMNANKNFLAADQETFEECNNVYMNAAGLLRSRPAVKQTGETNIVKYWNFNDTTIHLVKDGNTYTLKFFKNAVFKDSLQELAGDSINLIPKDNKIFIFADGVNFKYYDGSIKDADEYVYIPEIKVTDADETKNYESKNFLTDKEKFTYLYTSDNSFMGTLMGAQVSAFIDGVVYTFEYKEGSYISLYEKALDLPAPDSLCYILKTQLSETDVYVCLEMYDNTFDVISRIYVKIGEGDWKLRSSDLKHLKNDYLQNSCGISDDGLILYLITESDQLLFLSLLPNEFGVYDFSLDVMRSNVNFVRVVQADKYAAITCDTANKIIFTENNEITSSYDLSCIVKSADIRFAEETVDNMPTYSGTCIGDFNGTLKHFYFKLYTDGLETNGNHTRSYGVGILHENKLLHVAKLPPAYGSDNYAYYVDEGNGTNYIVGYDAGNEITDKTVRFSDDGRFVFLSEIYDLEQIPQPGFLKYLNKVTGQSVIVHSAGNESLYSFVGENYSYSNSVYSSLVKNPIALTVTDGASINQDFINNFSKARWSELDNFYVSNGSNLYISELRKNDDGEFLWYFPETNKESFTSEITALQPISSTEMAVFLQNEVWYTSYQEGSYYSYKSKLKSGISKGSDVITSYDGTSVIFPSERGLVALSYQNFVASTDQTLTYLSDAISEQFKEFVKHPVKLLRYQFWILAYSPELTTAYLFDLRNNSWWPMTHRSLPTEFYVVDNEVLLLSENKLFKLDESDEDYYDYDGTKYQINWNFKSQKLHLNAVNYYKHISNLTLYSVLDTDREMNFVMDVNNYRKQIDTTEIQTISYKVDTIRTFVKRVSYPKVNEFQYNVHQDDEREIRLPLSLSGITIKYKISGQVR